MSFTPQVFFDILESENVDVMTFGCSVSESVALKGIIRYTKVNCEETEIIIGKCLSSGCQRQRGVKKSSSR